MGCDSVYAEGYPNLFFDPDGSKLREGGALCSSVLEPLLRQSRLSISYGYISPGLSKRIVKYQDPNKPSYHRWDDGAACDVVLHDAIYEGVPPVHSAFWIDENLPVSRVISYSESPFICVATRRSEVQSGDHRRALYENRYTGERKPRFISYSNSPHSRRRQKEEAYKEVNFDNWIGAGHPTYHGGGRKQLQHYRTSKYTVLTDFLYSERAVTEGLPNKPPQRAIRKFRRAGDIYDEILIRTQTRRLSIIRAYESPAWSRSDVHTWESVGCFVFVPPYGYSTTAMAAEYVATEVMRIKGVTTTKVSESGRHFAVSVFFDF